MDEGALLVVAVCALVLVCVAWVTREVVAAARRRRAPAEQSQAWANSTVELMPLLLLPIASLVKYIGRNRTSIESLVGDDGTVSLLFCDIQGSTVLNRRLGDDEWVRVIRAHDEVVDHTIRRHRGRIVKTVGDGFMAGFRTPEDALGAAVSLERDLRECESIEVPLAVRVGVHTGEVVADRDDLFGTNVAMAARIAAAASGHEVLVSDAVRQRVANSDRFEFHRHRSLRLKGLPGRHRVHRATAA